MLLVARPLPGRSGQNKNSWRRRGGQKSSKPSVTAYGLSRSERLFSDSSGRFQAQKKALRKSSESPLKPLHSGAPQTWLIFTHQNTGFLDFSCHNETFCPRTKHFSPSSNRLTVILLLGKIRAIARFVPIAFSQIPSTNPYSTKIFPCAEHIPLSTSLYCLSESNVLFGQQIRDKSN